MGKLIKFETLKNDFLQSLSDHQYNLLKELTEHSSCIGDFLFRHPGFPVQTSGGAVLYT